MFKLIALVVSAFSVSAVAQNVDAAASKQDRAAEIPAIYTLPEIVVTATKTEQAPFDVPYAVNAVDAEEARLTGSARSAADALKAVPGVMIQQTSGQQQSPFIRGFTGYRTLFMVDGVRLNNSVFRDGPIQYFSTIDPLSIRAYEVVKGPASTLWGSDAIGGAINALTKRRTDYDRPGLNLNGEVLYRFSSAEHSNIGRVEVSGNRDSKLGFLMGGSLKRFGNLVGGTDTGTQANTGYNERDLDLRVDYHLSEGSTLTLVHQQYTSLDAPRAHRTIFAIPFSGTTPGKLFSRELDQRRALTYLNWESDEVAPQIKKVSATISFQKQTEDQHVVKAAKQLNGGFGPGGAYAAAPDSREEFGWDVGTLGLAVNTKSETPIGTLTYGGDVYRDSISSYQRLYDKNGSLEVTSLQGPIADDSRYTTTGFFVQDQFFVVPKRLEATLGGRYTRVKVHAGKIGDPLEDLATPNPISGLSFDKRWSAVATTARLLLRVDEQWHVFGGTSQGFRAPSLFDLTGDEQARTSEAQVGNTNLEPEKFASFELGVKTQQQNLDAQVSYFYNKIKNMIIRVPTGKYLHDDPTDDAIIEAKNGGHGFIHGVELDGNYRLDAEWVGYGVFTWMDGELSPQFSAADPSKPEVGPTSRLMPTQVTAGLRWTSLSKQYWADASGTLVKTQNKLSFGDKSDTSRIPPGGTPGYALMGVRAGWRVSKAFTATAGLENIANTDYRVHGSGVQGPGRNAVVNVDYKF